jgi:UPF0716 protein FxsA
VFIKLFAYFLLIPLVELFVLLKVGGLIGIGPTIALILLTGLAGAALVRSQGFVILGRIQENLAQGRLPTEELLDGALVLAGGVLLLTPGFCTDLLGFLLLVPLTRKYSKGLVRLWLQRLIEKNRTTVHRW